MLFILKWNYWVCSKHLSVNISSNIYAIILNTTCVEINLNFCCLSTITPLVLSYYPSWKLIHSIYIESETQKTTSYLVRLTSIEQQSDYEASTPPRPRLHALYDHKCALANWLIKHVWITAHTHARSQFIWYLFASLLAQPPADLMFRIGAEWRSDALVDDKHTRAHIYTLTLSAYTLHMCICRCHWPSHANWIAGRRCCEDAAASAAAQKRRTVNSRHQWIRSGWPPHKSHLCVCVCAHRTGRHS